MAKVDKQQQVQNLLKQAEDGVRAVFESENYHNYLAIMSKFHNYSYRNTLLIYKQKPEATHVAGYVAWQKNFKRQVQKDEKGIQIVGYTPKNVNQEQEKKDLQGNPILGADGKPETETVTRKIPYFTPVYVYDVSQTEGEPLPRLVNELDGSVEAYNDLMSALREVSPFPIVFEDIKGGANGYCSPLEQKIAVRQGMSEAQTVKTTIHEITHADLDAPEIDAALENKKDRRTKEVEAESTAFIVCNHYGIDTSDYSFGYLAAWSSTKELAELQSSLETIQKQANELIDRIDNRLAELQKDKPLEIENAAIPDKTVTIEEMQQYGYTDKGMLPLDATKATELFNAGYPVHILYSDNTESIAPTAASIAEHTGKDGLCGISSGDYNKVRAADLAARYDTLVTEKTAKKAFPFSIENQAERIDRITARIQDLDMSSLNFVVDIAIENTPDNINREALIREFSQLKEDCGVYTTDVLKDRLSEYHNEPIVTVRWSENPDLKGGETYPLHEANKIFHDYDAKYPDDMGYEKTAFSLIYEKDGEVSSYEGRQDFGDREGGIIDHIRNFWNSELSPNMISQHLAAGNTDMIDNAKEAINSFIPYLEAHNTLGLLADETRAQLGNLQFMKEQGATMPDLDKRIEYGQALLSYVAEARIALNTGAEAPTMPNREDYIASPVIGKEAAEIEAYKEEIRKEFTAEAAALGISVDAYAQNDYTAPAERSFSIYQLNATGRKYLFESFEKYGQDDKPSLSMYDKVYEGTLPPTATLDSIFEQFNIDRPADFTGHSLSVSDLIVIEYDGEITANYVDRFGFKNVPELAQEIKNIQPEKNNSIESITYGGLDYTVIDKWQDNIASYVVGQLEDDDGTWYAAKVTDITEQYHGEYEYEFGNDKPTRETVEDKHIDNIAAIDIDRYEAFFGADGNLSESLKMYGSRNFPNLNDPSPEEQRRANETLDSVKFDGDIDLDREKTREQLGFKDNPAKPLTAADIFKAAREKAARINGEADRQQQHQKQNNKNAERGE